jgi:hypothetical protein
MTPMGHLALRRTLLSTFRYCDSAARISAGSAEWPPPGQACPPPTVFNTLGGTIPISTEKAESPGGLALQGGGRTVPLPGLLWVGCSGLHGAGPDSAPPTTWPGC